MEAVETDAVDAVNSVEAAEVATEVEVGASELTETEGEVEDYSDGIDTSVDAVGELEEVHDNLAESVENGEGMSAETAKIAEIAVEAICAKVGISAKESKTFPTMESFGAGTSRLQATKLTMENIKEQVARIWKAIKDACAYVWNIVKQFFNGLVKNRKVMEKHIQNLKGKAKSLKDEAPKSKTLKVGAKAFSIDGSATPGTAIKILENSARLSGVAYKTSGLVQQLAKDVVDGKLDVSAKEVLRHFKELGDGVGDARSYSDAVTVGNFVNNRTIAIHMVKFLGSDYAKIAFINIPGKVAETIAAPDKKEINTILEKAEFAIKTLVEFEKTSKQLEAANKAAANYADKMLKISQKMEAAEKESDDKNDASKRRAADAKQRFTLKVINNLVSALGTAIPSVIYNACKSAADYANAGITNIGIDSSKVSEGTGSAPAGEKPLALPA